MELKTFIARDDQGNIVPAASATVYLPGTSVPATGLQTAAGAELANPFTGDAGGKIAFAAPDGDYDLNVIGGGRSTTMRVRFRAEPIGKGVPIVTEAGTSLTALATAAGKYTRFTHADPKTYSFDSAQTYIVGDEYRVRNVGAGDLTLTAVGTFVLNTPAGGTLVVPSGGTAMVKIIGAAEADVVQFAGGSSGGGGATAGPSFAPWGTAAGLDLLDGNTLAGKNVSLTQIRLARSAKFKGGGKWYVEFEVVNIGPISTNLSIGMASPDTPLSFAGIDGAGGNYIFFRGNGQLFRNGGYLGSAGDIFVSGDVVGFAFDGTSGGVVTIYKNGGVLTIITTSPGPFAPCVVFEAYTGIAVRMLSEPNAF